MRDDPDDFDFPTCSVCGAELERVSCCHCWGEGGFHDCGEDCCPCAYPEINVDCEICDGDGWYLECPALPHGKM